MNGGKEEAETNTCVALIEAPAPQVNVPADLNIQQLAEIAFQLTRMSPTQARELAQTIDWKTTLVLPIPRFAGSYSQVNVNGVQGTLINTSGRRGPGLCIDLGEEWDYLWADRSRRSKRCGSAGEFAAVRHKNRNFEPYGCGGHED